MDTEYTHEPVIHAAIIEAVLAVALPHTNEQTRHLEAFRYWFNGGNQRRGHQDVANYCGISKKTVGTWMTKYHWTERAAAIEQAAKDAVIEDTARDLAEELDYLLELSDDAIKAYRKELGNMRWKGADLKGLVETRLLLLGQPTERVEQTTRHELDGLIDDPVAIKHASALFARLGKGDADGSGTPR